MEQSRKNTLIITSLGALLLITVIISFWLGRYPITTKEVLGITLSKIYPLEQFWTERVETVLVNIRLPRVVLACLVGCSLSAAGAAYQGVFQNPMAAPDILGASAGAAFGAALAILNYGSSFTITISAFFFSLVTVFIVYAISRRVKGKSILGLILAGIVIGSLFSAATSFIKLVADPNDQLPAITYWLMGSLAGAKTGDIKFAFLPMAVGLVPLLLLRWRMNVLTMGDDEAKTMGINANQIRLAVIVCSTLTTAASVAVSGMIGWVGLVIPHLARRLVGNNYNHLMPASILIGAIFLLWVDNIARNLLTTEIPLGILTAFIGAPFFIYLIIRGENY
ncbi:MAG: FecCD family ABC transporter permease [Dethiobacteria bacterium]